MNNRPSGSADESKRQRYSERARTVFGGVISEVHATYFVLGTGGARFFFPPEAELTWLKAGDNVTVKAVRLGTKYVAETVMLNREPPA